MTITVCGINHKTAPITLREQLAIAPHDLNQALSSLLRCLEPHQYNEAIILSTCNRTEIYCQHIKPQQIIDWLAERNQIDGDELEQHCYYYHEQEALQHLIRVTSGLDSMMLGETQIHGQMKQAYQAAVDLGAVSEQLGPVFSQALHASKRIRNETDIGRYSVSIASAAADLVKEQYEELTQLRCLLIGAGETVSLAGEHLQALGVKHFIVANRTTANAEKLACQLNGEGYNINQLNQLLSQADIVISATNCPLPFVGKAMLEVAMQERAQTTDQAMCLIDLAVPRDIEAECAEVDNVNLYNVDDLHNQVGLNKVKREQAAINANDIIKQEVNDFYQWRQSLNAVDSINHFRRHVKALSDKEIERARCSLKNGDTPELVLEEFANRLLNKMLHQPSTRLRQAGIDGEKDLLQFTKALFHAEHL